MEQQEYDPLLPYEPPPIQEEGKMLVPSSEKPEYDLFLDRLARCLNEKSRLMNRLNLMWLMYGCMFFGAIFGFYALFFEMQVSGPVIVFCCIVTGACIYLFFRSMIRLNKAWKAVNNELLRLQAIDTTTWFGVLFGLASAVNRSRKMLRETGWRETSWGYFIPPNVPNAKPQFFDPAAVFILPDSDGIDKTTEQNEETSN
ncbi:MAG: hypothetical protein Q4G59_01670 [Planctomycetia bacterium]|nr:hypothetical protein [Planctomycetia bacterium]